MDLSKHFILLNGEPKTLQIAAIQWNGSNGYSVRFKNNGRTYNYGRDKVVWLNNPEWKDPTQCKVFVDSKLQNGIREIWRFDNNGIPIGGSSTTMVLCRMMPLVELLLLNPVSKRR